MAQTPTGIETAIKALPNPQPEQVLNEANQIEHKLDLLADSLAVLADRYKGTTRLLNELIAEGRPESHVYRKILNTLMGL